MNEDQLQYVIRFLRHTHSLYGIPLRLLNGKNTLYSIGSDNHTWDRPWTDHGFSEGHVCKYGRLCLHIYPTGILWAETEGVFVLQIGPVVLKDVRTVLPFSNMYPLSFPRLAVRESAIMLLNLYFVVFGESVFAVDDVCSEIKAVFQNPFSPRVSDAVETFMHENNLLIMQTGVWIKSGNPAKAEQSCQRLIHEYLKAGAGMDVMQLHLNGHFMLSVFSFAASESGMVIEKAYALYMQFVNRILTVGSGEECCALIAEMVSRFAESVQEDALRGYSHPVREACVYIGRHINERMPVEKIAKSIYLSESYLRKIFRNETGMTVQKYVEKKKIETACTLLAFSTQSITRIGQYLGYTNSYFAQLFYKEMGVTPKEYRKKC